MSLTEDEKQSINQRDYLSCFIKEKDDDDTLPAM